MLAHHYSKEKLAHSFKIWQALFPLRHPCLEAFMETNRGTKYELDKLQSNGIIQKTNEILIYSCIIICFSTKNKSVKVNGTGKDFWEEAGY